MWTVLRRLLGCGVLIPMETFFLGRQQVAVLVGMTFLVIELVSCGRDGRELFGKLNLLGFN